MALPATVTEINKLPKAPTGLAATADGGFMRILLTWTDSDRHRKTFEIHRSLDGATGWSLVGTVTATKWAPGLGHFVDSGLSLATQYYYRIRAYNDAGFSRWSSTVNATTFDIDVLSPVSWGEADDIAGDDGDAISSYDDKQSNTWAQGTGSKQPLLKKDANGINGHNVIRFDGTDDLLRYSGTLSTATSGTIFIVCRFTSALQNYQTLLASADEAGTGYYWLCRYHDTTDPNFRIGQANNDTESGAYAHNETANAGQTYIAQFSSTGTAYGFRIDRQEEEQTTSGGGQGDWFGDTSNRDSVTLGALKRSSEIHFLKGDIAEWLVFDSNLSDANKKSIEDYLTEKYKYTATLSVSAIHKVPSPYVFATGLAVGAISDGGGDEIAFGSGGATVGDSGTIRAIDRLENPLFSYDSASSDYALGMAIGDVDGDGDNEIATTFHDTDHVAALLSHTGSELWTWSTVAGYHTYLRCAAIGELDGGVAGKEVVIGGGLGTLALLDKDGNEIWVKEGATSLCSGCTSGGGAVTVQGIAIEDTDGDAQNEIIIGYALTVRKFDYTGTQTWSQTLTTGSSYIYGVYAGQITSDTGKEIAAVGGTALFILDKDGNTLSQTTLKDNTWSVIGLDIDSDTYDELFVGYGTDDTSGWVAVVDNDGQEIGSIKVGESPKFLAKGDVDNDGSTEIVVSSDDGYVYILEIA